MNSFTLICYVCIYESLSLVAYVCIVVFWFRSSGPGEMGKGVVVPPEREQEMKELFKINQFNLIASEMIALNRSLPDYRMSRLINCVCCG